MHQFFFLIYLFIIPCLTGYATLSALPCSFTPSLLIGETPGIIDQKDELKLTQADDEQRKGVNSLEVNRAIDGDSEEPELLLTHIEENGGVTSYQYDSLSKQCTVMLCSDQDHLLFRCFYRYDDQGFLEQAVCDDGQGQEVNDLRGATRRHTICLQVGSESPLLGKPLKIENYVWEPNCSDSTGTLVHEMHFQYDQQGQLVSTIDSQGEMTFFKNFNPFTHVQCEYVNVDNLYEQMSIGHIWDSVVNAFFSGFHYLQLSAHQARMKWNAELNLPTPIGKALEKIAKALFGEATYLLMGPHFEETYVDCYGRREISDKVRLTFINGILNTRSILLQSLDFISESHGGIKVHYVFRPTEGWTGDISRAVFIRTAFTLGFRSQHAYLLAQQWRELIQEMGGIEGGGVIVHYAHSLGGSDTDRARELLSLEEQKMIRVVTFGSATLIRNVGFQSVINIVSVNDGVSSFFLEPLGHIRNYFDPETNVHFYGSFLNAPYWPTDHLLNGPTYGPLLKSLGDKFLLEFMSK